MRAALLPVVLSVACSLAAAGPVPTTPASPGPVQDTLAQRMQACVVCHGKEGRASNTGYFPRIAGKPAGYLYHQLQHFQSGRRQNGDMRHLVQFMSDDYLRAIAQYFASLDLPSPPAQATRLTVEQERTARRVVMQGAPERGLPACTSCHGQQLAGRLPATPGLLTLPADYLRAQLGAWRTGQRKAHAPDCMGDVARRLTPEEIDTTARWLSAQTLPAGTSPDSTPPPPLRMTCGDAPR